VGPTLAPAGIWTTTVDWALASGNAKANPETERMTKMLAATETFRDILDENGILSH
jgi:hypothetical protein